MATVRHLLRANVRSGDLLLVALLALPVILAWPRLGIPDPADSAAVLRWTARVSGIAAMICMVLAALLSARLPGVDRWFGGLPRIWGWHRALGYWAFVLIMTHVLAIAFAGVAGSPEQAVATLFPGAGGHAIWAGWAAWLLMLAFVWPTFGLPRPPAYQRWKRLHLLSAPMLVLALAHVLWLTPPGAVWWALGGAGLLAIGWRKVLAPRMARHEHQVVKVTPLTDDVVEIALRPRGAPVRFRPGQFVYLTPFDEDLAAGRGEEHPYTIASAPGDPLLRIGIKNLGDASGALQTVSVGSSAAIEGPYGCFFQRHHPGRGQLWFGGGIGITPFVAGARALADEQLATAGDIHLFYLADRPERAYYLEELQRLAATSPGLEVTPHYFRSHGAITGGFLQQHCGDFASREIYICGPQSMRNHLLDLLRRHGVPRYRIHTEAFDFL